MHRLSAVRFTIAIVLGSAAVAGCGSSKQSAAAWKAKVDPICAQLIADRNAGTAGFTTEQPSADQLTAFYVSFAPKLATASKAIKALKRPSGLDSQVTELFAALDGVVAYVQNSSTDPAAVQAEISGVGSKHDEVFGRLQAATTAAGIPECNG